MKLSNKLEKLGYLLKNDMWIYYDGDLIGVSHDLENLENLIRAHNQFLNEKDSYINNKNKNKYEISWNREGEVYLRYSTDYHLIGSFKIDELNDVVNNFELLLKNEFKINLTKEQIKNGYELSWKDLNSSFLGFKETGFFKNNEYKCIGIVNSNEDVNKTINEFEKKEIEEEIDFEF